MRLQGFPRVTFRSAGHLYNIPPQSPKKEASLKLSCFFCYRADNFRASPLRAKNWYAVSRTPKEESKRLSETLLSASGPGGAISRLVRLSSVWLDNRERC